MAQQSHPTTLQSNPKKEFEPSKAEGSLIPTDYTYYPKLKPPIPASIPETEDEVEYLKLLQSPHVHVRRSLAIAAAGQVH